MVVILISILFTALIFDMYVKITCIIGIFINFLIHIFITFLRIIFKIYYFGCFFFLAIILLLCVFVNTLHVSYFFFLLILTIIFYQQVLLFFRTHTDIDKVGYCLPSNNNDYLNNLWLFFAILFFFLKIWFNNRSNIKLRLLLLNCFCAALFTQAY